jgi:hypothetical protein
MSSFSCACNAVTITSSKMVTLKIFGNIIGADMVLLFIVLLINELTKSSFE